MSQYVIRRLLQSLILLVGITLITFSLMQLAPGNPLTMMIDPDFDPQEIAAARSALGMDRPILVQYFSWLQELVKGNLGYAVRTGRSVSSLILNRLPATLLLTIASWCFAYFFGILLGVLSALNRGRFSDYFLTVFSFLGLSIPNFFLGLFLIFIFSIQLNWFPTSGYRTLFADLQGLGLIMDRLKYLILPSIALGFPGLATAMRFTRSSVLEVLAEDFVRTARSKGLSERIVIYKHALRNALLPVVTILGLSVPFLFSGSFIIESVFGWPGMGKLGVDAVFAREYPIIMGVNLIASTLVLLGNLGADLLYAVVDPRIRYT